MMKPEPLMKQLGIRLSLVSLPLVQGTDRKSSRHLSGGVCDVLSTRARGFFMFALAALTTANMPPNTSLC